MKEKIKNLPVIGPIVVHIVRKFRGVKEREKYIFERATLPFSSKEDANFGVQQIVNLLNYTKTSASDYNAQDFPAGYHTLDLKNLSLAGQRQPAQRIKNVPYDFTAKTVLDIGCNQGGMLYSVIDKISHGVGIDYDHRLINAANKIRAHTKTSNLDFYVFDVEKEDLNLMRDLVPGGRVDIVFLLAVCMWIRNWKQVIDFSQSISDYILFESNGSAMQQDAQVSYLRDHYKAVEQLTDTSDDDSSQRSRRLYLCHSKVTHGIR